MKAPGGGCPLAETGFYPRPEDRIKVDRYRCGVHGRASRGDYQIVVPGLLKSLARGVGHGVGLEVGTWTYTDYLKYFISVNFVSICPVHHEIVYSWCIIDGPSQKKWKKMEKKEKTRQIPNRS